MVLITAVRFGKHTEWLSQSFPILSLHSSAQSAQFKLRIVRAGTLLLQVGDVCFVRISKCRCGQTEHGRKVIAASTPNG
ncbi:Dper\GL22888-PA-like protein [Anopheles sinensis]|uniref:Dper\GL22888-PA-like protein n=1 Tax=Anopheles sinensis TaxID=74873 RepID=A0A084VLH3_ANOSI|nr:Dper\GL22888-PA-like protein [Anopheles sinensis]